jgi:hypothetical protein
MLELVAISREDGWAYVRTDTGIRLVRPPYAQWSTTPVSEAAVEPAILNHGFTSVQRQFSQWKEVIEYLNGEICAARDATGQQLPENGLGEQMLAFAPDDILMGFLERVDRELLPNGEWRSAEKILMAMLKLERIRQNMELGERTVVLLERAQRGLDAAQDARRILLQNTMTLETIFPRAIDRYGRDAIAACSSEIAERQQIFAFAK